MRYLLDTHTVIWYLDNSRRLPPRTEEIIDDDNNRVYISSISLWETAIKVNLGKLELNSTFDQFLENVRNSDFGILQIKDAYLKKLSILPSVHRDPFDRLLISTALVENLTLITEDDTVRKYNVSWIW